MNAMLDIILSTIIGGMLLLGIVTAILDVQANSTNLKYQITLTKITEKEIDIIDYYTKKVGAGVHPDSVSIVTALDTVFTFKAKEFSDDANPSEFSVYQGTPTEKGYPIRVSKNGTSVFGPIWLADSISFNFFDRNGSPLTFPLSTAEINSIGYMSIAMAPFMKGAVRRGNNRDILNKIVFWSIFTNLYL